MFNNVALDVVIGLIFVFLLYSLLVTIIQEILATRLSFRAKFLLKAVTRMLEDDDKKGPTLVHLGIQINPSEADQADHHFTQAFYAHPLIKYLGERPGSRSKPAYLVDETFAKVVIDILRGPGAKPGEDIRLKIQQTLDDKEIKVMDPASDQTQAHKIKPQTLHYLRSIWTDAQGDVERFRELLENWFHETMDRTTGWYKKYAQYVSFMIGFVLAIAFNVDTIAIAHKLEKDPKLREQLVQQADAFVKAHPNLDEELNKEKQAIQQAAAADASPARDSTQRARNNQADAEYRRLKAKRDSLVNQATDLVNGDIAKTNEVLGLGITHYQWPPCAKCTPCQKFGKNTGAILRSLVGWLITALALSLGAPFWFDLLNKLMRLRSSVASSTTDDKAKDSEVVVPKIKRVG